MRVKAKAKQVVQLVCQSSTKEQSHNIFNTRDLPGGKPFSLSKEHQRK